MILRPDPPDPPDPLDPSDPPDHPDPPDPPDTPGHGSNVLPSEVYIYPYNIFSFYLISYTVHGPSMRRGEGWQGEWGESGGGM